MWMVEIVARGRPPGGPIVAHGASRARITRGACSVIRGTIGEGLKAPLRQQRVLPWLLRFRTRVRLLSAIHCKEKSTIFYRSSPSVVIVDPIPYVQNDSNQ